MQLMTTLHRLERAAKPEAQRPLARIIIPARVARIIVPGTPTSVNHYVKHTRTGRHYKTAEAKAWEDVFGWATAGMSPLLGRHYKIVILVFLGKGQRGDWDNFPKLVGDCLQRRGIIKSDSLIRDGRVILDRDAENPRTEIYLEAI